MEKENNKTNKQIKKEKEKYTIKQDKRRDNNKTRYINNKIIIKKRTIRINNITKRR